MATVPMPGTTPPRFRWGRAQVRSLTSVGFGPVHLTVYAARDAGAP